MSAYQELWWLPWNQFRFVVWLAPFSGWSVGFRVFVGLMIGCHHALFGRQRLWCSVFTPWSARKLVAVLKHCHGAWQCLKNVLYYIDTCNSAEILLTAFLVNIRTKLPSTLRLSSLQSITFLCLQEGTKHVFLGNQKN